MEERRVVVIIPALNPGNSLLKLIEDLIQYGFKRIIVINDGSTEGNKIFEELEKYGTVIILTHHENLGKGRALKTGFNYCLNNYSEYRGVITVDADGQHQICDIVKCAESLEQNYLKDLMILGSRRFAAQEVPFRSRFGNICTRYVLRYLCNIKVSDSQTGLRAISMHMLGELLKVTGEGYEYETNVLLQVTDKAQIIEIPIMTIYEDNNSTSHFNPVLDSLRIYFVIMKYSLASLVAVVLDNLTFIVLSTYTANIYLMTYAGRIISAIFNFMLNKILVFKKKGNARQEVIRYLLLLLLSGSISAFLVSILYRIIHINVIVLKIMVEFILYFFNFWFQKNFVFKENGKNRI